MRLSIWSATPGRGAARASSRWRVTRTVLILPEPSQGMGMRNTRKRWIAGLLGLVILLCSVNVYSATDTGSGMYLETLAAKLFQMAKNVIVPVLLIGIVLFAGANVAFGFMQIGPGVGRMLFGAAIILGGIE